MSTTELHLSEIMNEILCEYFDASDKFPPFHSSHEGYAVILEELDELWNSIKANRPSRSEAIQVAAMALRFVVDMTQWNDKGLLDHRERVSCPTHP